MRPTSGGTSRSVVWSRYLFVLGAIGWGVGLIGCNNEPPCGSRPLDGAERACLVSEVTERVEKEYPFADLNGVEMEAWSREVRTLADEDLGEVAFLRQLEQKVSDLRDGHTNLGWASPGRGARPAVRAQMLPQGYYVTRVGEPNGTWKGNAEASIERGDRITKMGNTPIRQHFDRTLENIQASTPTARHRIASYALLSGPPKSSVTVTIEGKGRVTLPRKRPKFSPVPEPNSEIYGNIGYIVPKTFGFVDDIERVDRLINEMMHTDGLVIDLRGNGGGVTAVPDAILGRLFEDQPPAFAIKDRNGRKEAEMRPGRRGDIYDGPVAVLTNAHTFSAANYFAQRIKYHDRGVIVGRRTGGGAGLPNPSVEIAGGVFFRVSGDVVRTPTGGHSEKGIAPDIDLPVTPSFLATSPEQHLGDPDRDRTLRQAIEYLRRRSK